MCYQTKSSLNFGNTLSHGYRSDFKRLSDLVCIGPDTEVLSRVCPICYIWSDESTARGLGTSPRNTRECTAVSAEPQALSAQATGLPVRLLSLQLHQCKGQPMGARDKASSARLCRETLTQQEGKQAPWHPCPPPLCPSEYSGIPHNKQGPITPVL